MFAHRKRVGKPSGKNINLPTTFPGSTQSSNLVNVSWCMGMASESASESATSTLII